MASLKKVGGGEIRTHGAVAHTTVFKTVPLNRSGTPPDKFIYIKYYKNFCLTRVFLPIPLPPS